MGDTLRVRAEACLSRLRQDRVHGHAQLAQLQELLAQITGAIEVLEQLLAPSDMPPLADDGHQREEGLCPSPNTDGCTS